MGYNSSSSVILDRAAYSFTLYIYLNLIFKLVINLFVKVFLILKG